MNRITLQTVTALPVLVPCQVGEESGFVDATPVRVITTELIIGAVKKRTGGGPLGLNHDEWKFLRALKLLQRAHEKNDPLAAEDGAALLIEAQYFPLDESAEGRRAGAPTAREVIEGLSKNTVQKDATLMAGLINLAVKGAGPVQWQPGKWRPIRTGEIVDNCRALQVGNARGIIEAEVPTPGMLCPDVGTAVSYVMLFDGLHICLRCHRLFQGPENREYCSIRCRESHRVARFRYIRKERERKAQQRRKKKGGAQ